MQKKAWTRKDDKRLIHHLVPIEERPKFIQKRIRPGEFEVNNMMAKTIKDK
jgi:IS30 family transposase